MEPKRKTHQFEFIRKRYSNLEENELEKADYAFEAYVRLVRSALNELKAKDDNVDSRFDSLSK